MLAVRKGHLKMGEVLIKAGADVDKVYCRGSYSFVILYIRRQRERCQNISTSRS